MTTSTHPTAAPAAPRSLARRVLGSGLVDLLVGPHGIDRYLELIRPSLTIEDARAEVVAVRRQTPRSVTITLRPNRAFAGFRAGQFLKVGVEIDAVRRTRTYSPASSAHAWGTRAAAAPAGARPRPDAAVGDFELTVTRRDDGAVSTHLIDRLTPGTLIHLGPAQGDFVLPEPRPERLVLISGGSGITPVMAMLRTLCDEGHAGPIAFLHYARTAADWLYRAEVDELAARHPNLHAAYIATRDADATADADADATTDADATAEPDRTRHLTPETIDALPGGDWRDAHVAVCGPPALIEATEAVWSHAPGRVISETFTPPTLALIGAAASGTVRFTASGLTAPIAEGTLLEQAEAAGLSPEFGCRMGICHTCVCHKTAGAVTNILTGEVSDEEDEDIQLCVSVPAGDVALVL